MRIKTLPNSKTLVKIPAINCPKRPSQSTAALKNQSFLVRFGYALAGIKSAFGSESSFRIQLSITIGVILVLGILRANPLWWALHLLCFGAVLTAEMFNTALEHLIDHIHPERHTAIGVAKDCAAGAVLISSGMSVLVFAFFLVDRLAAY